MREMTQRKAAGLLFIHGVEALYDVKTVDQLLEMARDVRQVVEWFQEQGQAKDAQDARMVLRTILGAADRAIKASSEDLRELEEFVIASASERGPEMT